MTKDGTGIAIAPYCPTRHSSSAKFDVNEALRTLADLRQNECNSQNIAVVMDLAADLPATAADSEEIEKVLDALFSQAQKAIVESGNSHGSIAIRTKFYAGRVQLSLTHDGLADPINELFDGLRETSGDNLALTLCAQNVQDQAGELYVWRPRLSPRVIIIMDLPVDSI